MSQMTRGLRDLDRDGVISLFLICPVTIRTVIVVLERIEDRVHIWISSKAWEKQHLICYEGYNCKVKVHLSLV